MIPDEFTPVDEQCASLLAACHEALLAGDGARHLTEAEISPEVRARLEVDLACVRLLDQVLPRQPGAAARDTPLAPDVKYALTGTQPPTAIGRFRIRRELGRGGYGIVFQAFDPQLGREVALKVPRAEAVLTPELRERFVREARAAAVLDHPNVVPVYEAGAVGPVCYIASAYCPGTTLDDWCKTRPDPVPCEQAATLVATLAQAVHHAHVNGVVHRDLKPANVLLQVAQGRSAAHSAGRPGTQSAPFELPAAIPKITDFGLAKFHAPEPGTTAQQYHTQAGAIVGTPRYMAPEQAAGSQAVGPAADVHALGVILYEVLTGRPPFVAETVLDTLEQVRSHDPLPPSRLRSKLPRDLETICVRCLQKEPAKRYTGAGELAADLRRFVAGEPIQARPIRAWERAVKWARRRKAAAALVTVSSLASLVLLAGLVIGIVLIADKQRETEGALRKEKLTSYLNGIDSAFHEISAKNWGRGEELLEECPPELRGWEWHFLKRLRHTAPIDPIPIGESVTMSGGGFDPAFHPDGRLLAIPSSGNSIRIWDTANRRAVLRLCGHKGRVLSLAFSPDGQRLASTSEDKTLRVWDVTTLAGERLQSTTAAGTGGTTCPPEVEVCQPVFTCDHNERVIGVAYSPDGRHLASASSGTTTPGEVKLWDAGTGELLASFPGTNVPNPVVHPAFSPDSRRLASGSVDNTVKVWDVAMRRELFELRGHSEPILSVTFTPDGRRLISAGRDRVVNVWELPPGQPGASATGGQILQPRWTLPDFSTSRWSVALSTDGSHLAVGGPRADGNVRVYDMATGQMVHKLMGDIRVISLTFSADGRRLVAAGGERTIRLWDVMSGKLVLGLAGHPTSVGRVVFSPDGQRLASVSGSGDGTVLIWDASPFDAKADPHSRTLGEQDGEFNGVAFSPDGRFLASASSDKLIKLWDVQTGRAVRIFAGHTEPAVCVAYSPDGRYLLSGSMDKTVKLWDLDTGAEAPLPGGQRFKLMVYSVAFSPNTPTLAFATGAHQEVQVWDLNGRSILGPLRADPEFVSCVAFSADGKYLAGVGHSKTAKVWDIPRGIEICSFKGHDTSVYSVAFHPSGKYLASGDTNFKVRLWNPSTGREVHASPLAKHSDFVESMAFSQDGKYLATASLREIIVWDAERFKVLRTFDRLAGRIWSVAFSPDGKRLSAATGYKGKGEIKVWDLWAN